MASTFEHQVTNRINDLKESFENQIDHMAQRLILENAEDQCWSTWFNIQAAESVQTRDETKRKRLKAEFDFMALARLMRSPYSLVVQFMPEDALTGTNAEIFERFKAAVAKRVADETTL